jgi:hypothetical protein
VVDSAQQFLDTVFAPWRPVKEQEAES